MLGGDAAEPEGGVRFCVVGGTEGEGRTGRGREEDEEKGVEEAVVFLVEKVTRMIYRDCLRCLVSKPDFDNFFIFDELF